MRSQMSAGGELCTAADRKTGAGLCTMSQTVCAASRRCDVLLARVQAARLSSTTIAEPLIARAVLAYAPATSGALSPSASRIGRTSARRFSAGKRSIGEKPASFQRLMAR